MIGHPALGSLVSLGEPREVRLREGKRGATSEGSSSSGVTM